MVKKMLEEEKNRCNQTEKAFGGLVSLERFIYIKTMDSINVSVAQNNNNNVRWHFP